MSRCITFSVKAKELGSINQDIEFLVEKTNTNRSWVIKEAVRQYADKVRKDSKYELV